MSRHSHRRRHAARLERSGRIQPFILDEDIGKLAAGKHRRKSFAQRNGQGVRKNLGISPHASYAPRQIFAAQLPFQTGKIVADKKHPSVFRTNILRALGRDMLSAAGAFEVGNLHRGKDSTWPLTTTWVPALVCELSSSPASTKLEMHRLHWTDEYRSRQCGNRRSLRRSREPILFGGRFCIEHGEN